MGNPFPLDLSVLKKVLDYLNDAVYITDRERQIVLWNRRAEEITGRPSADVVGCYCRNSILAHTNKDGLPLCTTQHCPLHRAMVTNAPSRKPEIIYGLTAHRGRIPLSVSVAPLHDEAGNVIGGIEIFRDESENIRDLEFAQRIQRSILPARLPQFRTLELAVRYHPAELIGGDFYDAWPVAAETAAVLVADVRGHGVSAALFTTALNVICQSVRSLGHDPAAFLGAANRQLAALAMDEVFATALYLTIEGTTGLVRYANAGHPAPLRTGIAGEAVPLEGRDLPLGFAAEDGYQNHESRLEPGELLLLCTDGALEIPGPDGALLGAPGLAKLLGRFPEQEGDHLLSSLYDALVRACAVPQFPDDLLLLSCRRKPCPAGPGSAPPPIQRTIFSGV